MVTVPKYSTTGGEVAMPTRRLTGLSGQDIQNMQRPGYNLQRLGQGISNVAGQLGKYIEDQGRKEAQMWLVSAEASLREDTVALETDLQSTVELSDYTGNSSVMDGSSSGTYTNKLMGGIEGILNSTEAREDGSTYSRYKPPNKYAEELWAMKLDQIKSGYKVSAMRYEASIRSAAKLEQLNEGFELTRSQLALDPSKLPEAIASLSILETGEDLPGTDKMGGIKTRDLIGVANEQKRAMTFAAAQGLIVQDPFMAYAILTGNSGKLKDVEPHVLNDFVSLLSPEQILSLGQSAKSRAMVIHTKQEAEFTSLINQHILSLQSGGQGFAEFNTERGFEAGIENLFGGKYGALKIELIPELAEKADAFYTENTSKILVARKVGLISKNLGRYSDKDLSTLSTIMMNAMEEGIVEEEELLKLLAAEGADETMIAVKDFNVMELGMFIDALQSQVSSHITARAKDIAGYALVHGKLGGADLQKDLNSTTIIESGIPDNSLAGGHPLIDKNYGEVSKDPDFLNELQAWYEDSGYDPDKMPLLTKSYAETLVAQANALRGEERAGFIDMLKSQYPEHLDQVMRQLTTMKNGLGLDFQLISAFHGTGNALMLGQASSADVDTLRANINQDAGFNKGKFYQEVMLQGEDMLTSFTGGVPGREAMKEEFITLLVKASMQQVAQHDNLQVGQAVKNVLESIQGDFTTFNSEDYDFYIMQNVHTRSDGSFVDGAAIATKLDKIMENRESIIDTLLADSRVVTPDSLIPTIQNDAPLRMQYFADHLNQHARWVMSDDSDGLMLVYPVAGSASTSASGGGVMVPALNPSGEPFTLTWDEIIQFKVFSRDAPKNTVPKG